LYQGTAFSRAATGKDRAGFSRCVRRSGAKAKMMKGIPTARLKPCPDTQIRRIGDDGMRTKAAIDDVQSDFIEFRELLTDG
jgi:hypothetical protein